MLNFCFMTKPFIFYIIFFGLCVSFSNSTKSQSVKRFYMSQNKFKQNFSTSIKIIDLSRLRLASSTTSTSTLSYVTTVTPKITKLIKKRKKLKLKRKKLQRIFKSDDTLFDGKLSFGLYFWQTFLIWELFLVPAFF